MAWYCYCASDESKDPDQETRCEGLKWLPEVLVMYELLLSTFTSCFKTRDFHALCIGVSDTINRIFKSRRSEVHYCLGEVLLRFRCQYCCTHVIRYCTNASAMLHMIQRLCFGWTSHRLFARNTLNQHAHQVRSDRSFANQFHQN
jgi:hypothetical protein